MYYLDLFAGIGGFALGAYRAGWRFDEHYYSEIDKYCNELYRLRFPDAIPLGDITTLNAENLPQGIWVVTGGFPCQDISVAGKGEGISGARSGLWFEMWRIIRILRPRFVIIENVGAITFRGLGSVLSSLAEIGYDAEWQDIRASDVGAPHKRERIWIIAYSQENTPCTHTNGSRLYREEKHKQRETKLRDQQNGIVRQMGQDVADTARTGLPEREEGGQQQPLLHAERRGIEVSDTTKQRLQGQESTGRDRGESGLFTECCGWEFEPNVGRLAHGVPRRVDRLKGLGNSIVPQIAELLFRRIGETYG